MNTYTISELAREFAVTPRALRFYEDKDLLHPARDGMNRIYSSRDRARLKLILQGKRVGFSLNDIREILDIYSQDGHQAQLLVSLKKFREQIAALEQQRKDIDASIKELLQGVKWAEEKLRDMKSAADGAAVAGASSRPVTRPAGPDVGVTLQR